MSAIPRPKRDAIPGEIVNFYEAGDPTEVPYVATVHSVAGGNCTLTYQRPGHPAIVTKMSVKHIHDTYWDHVSLQNKQSSGAFDFHPVYGSMFDKWQAAAHMREEAKRKREEARANDEMSEDEFNAINALERHGDNISAICTDTGLTPAQLKKLPKFSDELSKVKADAFEKKNAARK